MIKKLLISILFILFSSSLFSITEISSIEQIQQFAIESSIEYKNSQLNLEEAEEDVKGILLLDSTSLSVRTSNSDLENGDWGLTTSIEIPIVEQLSITGDIDEDLSGSIGLSINPLAHSETVVRSEVSYKTAFIEVETAYLEAQNEAVSASLNWMIVRQNMKIQNKRVDLNLLLYNDDKDRYQLGDITLDQLQDSLVTWSESRKELLEINQSYKQAEKSLYSSLGVNSTEVKLNILTIANIEESLKKLKADIDINQGNFLKSSSYRLSNYSVESAKENFNKTWVYEPSLSADLGMTYSAEDSETSVFNASINFSITLDDFQSKKRDRAEESYKLSVREMELKRNEAELDFNQALEELESSLINSEIYRIEYDQALLLFYEGELLFKAGDYSEVELEQSHIYLEGAKNSLFNSLADEYKVWMDFRKYL
ncbi:MAG: TolC family protein [Spirochaetaceae bacterium]